VERGFKIWQYVDWNLSTPRGSKMSLERTAFG